MDPFIYDDITDAVMRKMNPKWQVEYIDPKDIIFYGRTGVEVARILQNILDALQSPRLQGRIHCSAEDVENQEHLLGEIVDANRTKLDRFGRLRVLTQAISSIVFSEFRSDHQKQNGRYGSAVEDVWGHYGVAHSERDCLVYGYIRQIFQLVCPLFCDLFLTCHGCETFLNKAEPNGVRELTVNSLSSFPVLQHLVDLVKSDQFTDASNHMENAFYQLCKYMNRLDVFH